MAILQIQLHSDCLKRTVPISVILPVDGGDTAAPLQPLPALYLLHGIFGSQLDWLTATSVARYAGAQGVAVIMPAGENGFYVDAAATGQRYGAFIGEELPRLCRRMFPLSARREDTFLGGLSMGGYGAIRNGLTYPDTFGAVAAFSSALMLRRMAQAQPGELFAGFPVTYYESLFGPMAQALGGPNDCDALAERLMQSRGAAAFPRILLRCGESDALLPMNRDYHERLSALGVAHTFETEPGDHEWNFWDRSVKRALEWLAQPSEG